MTEHHYYVYTLTNDFHNPTYTGATNDLRRHVWEHKEKLADGYTKKYHIGKLVL
jgi:putative endonuclease